MQEIIRIAATELGIAEVGGSEDNPRIVQYAREAGFSQIQDDETAWCSIFMNWVALKAKYQRTKKLNARSWLDLGRHVHSPEPGDVVIYWRVDPNSWQGHVGIYMGYSQDQSRIYTLGGNQGNSVSISAYSTHQLLGFRRLLKNEDLSLPNENLERGDKGDGVARLQDALKLAGFNPGTSDGHFGPRTEAAVKTLQAHSGSLEINGIANRATKKYLLSLINTD